MHNNDKNKRLLMGKRSIADDLGDHEQSLKLSAHLQTSKPDHTHFARPPLEIIQQCSERENNFLEKT